MERDDLYSLIWYDLHHFLEELEQSNAMVVAVAFQQQNDYQPLYLLRDAAVLTYQLN